MIKPYRRHSATCKHADKGRDWRHCNCPIWADGSLGAVEMRKSLDTRSWDEAAKKILKMEADQKDTAEGRRKLKDAWAEYIDLKRADEVSDKVIKKYELLRDRLEAFLNVTYVDEVSLDQLTRFRLAQKWNLRTTLKHIERIRAFFRYCAERNWTPRGNPAKNFGLSKGAKQKAKELAPTLPFTPEEMVKLLSACEKYEAEVGPAGRDNAKRLRALVLLMRHSGLRISDAVNFQTTGLNGDKVFLRTEKTGVHVGVPVPPEVVTALAAIPRVTATRYFWSGNGQLATATKDFEARVARLLELAEVPKGECFMVSHRFRDSFAVAFLDAGGSIDELSKLLGHTSIRVTEKHYAPWVKSRQEKLEASVRRMWEGTNRGTEQVRRVLPFAVNASR